MYLSLWTLNKNNGKIFLDEDNFIWFLKPKVSPKCFTLFVFIVFINHFFISKLLKT